MLTHFRSILTPASWIRLWRRWWVRFAGPHGVGRCAARLAAWSTMPHHGKTYLATLHPRGYVAHTAALAHPDVHLGKHVYLGDGVYTFRTHQGGPIYFADRVQLYGNTILQTGLGASIRIGAGTHIQPGCHLTAYVKDIVIGENVEIAPNCGFYSFDHGISTDKPIMHQPLNSKGPIVIGNGAWLGFGVVVLSGVCIGEGAVIGAGAVVTRNVPPNAIAVGNPAKVVKFRNQIVN